MRRPPARATTGLCVVTALASVFALLSGELDYAAVAGGFIPARVADGLDLIGAVPVWLTPFTATLLHGGWGHLLMNLVMLGYCGGAVEWLTGPARLILLYIVGAFAAAAAQWAVGADSGVPMIGASGAISALLGAYALLFGASKRASANPALDRPLQILWLAGAWIGLQALMGLALPGIAIAAHVGGFLAGLLLARPLIHPRFKLSAA